MDISSEVAPQPFVSDVTSSEAKPTTHSNMKLFILSLFSLKKYLCINVIII